MVRFSWAICGDRIFLSRFHRTKIGSRVIKRDVTIKQRLEWCGTMHQGMQESTREPAKTNEETSISLDMQKEHSRTNLILDLFHLEWLRFESLSWSNLLQQRKKMNTLVYECCNYWQSIILSYSRLSNWFMIVFFLTFFTLVLRPVWSSWLTVLGRVGSWENLKIKCP